MVVQMNFARQVEDGEAGDRHMYGVGDEGNP
jgi:hypothetical protein